MKYIWWLLTRHKHDWDICPGFIVPDLTIDQCINNWGVYCEGCGERTVTPMNHWGAYQMRKTMPQYKPEEPK